MNAHQHPHHPDSCSGGCEDMGNLEERVRFVEAVLIKDGELRGLSMVQRVAYVLASDPTPLRFVTLWLYFLSAIGFYLQVGGPEDYEITYLLKLAPHWVWCGTFASLFFIRFFGIFTNIHVMYTNYWRVFTSTVGVIVWSFVLAGTCHSGLIATLNVLYIIPCLIETWLLGRALDRIISGDVSHG